MPEPEAPKDQPLDDVLLQLDRELNRLPLKYRAPILLCDLQGKTHQEAAIELGWPIGTVSGRLSRARAMLAKRLSCHGKVVSSGLLAIWLAQESALASLPSQIVGSMAHVASLFSTGGVLATDVISTEAVVLTREVLKAMLLGKLKIVSLIVVVSLALAAGGTALAYRAQTRVEPTEPTSNKTIKEVNDLEVALAQTQDRPVEKMASYASRIDAEDVYEFPELVIDYGDYHLEGSSVSVVAISTQKGTTGAMIIGNGKFRFSPKGDKAIEGHFRAVMLRFCPEEQATIIPLEKGKKVTDQGAAEMSRHLLQVVGRHCWHRGQELLIPSKGDFAGVFYTKEHGDLLISSHLQTASVFNFTSRKSLYERK